MSAPLNRVEIKFQIATRNPRRISVLRVIDQVMLGLLFFSKLGIYDYSDAEVSG
jgi:hypothetical protein